MFWLILLVHIIGYFLNEHFVIGINKTVNWQYDLGTSITIWIAFAIFFSWIGFLIGYGLLALLKLKSDYKLSIIHFFLFGYMELLGMRLQSLALITFIVGLISIIVFVVNMVVSTKHKVSTGTSASNG
nr:hypothetical protein [Allomuricauda sp.]